MRGVTLEAEKLRKARDDPWLKSMAAWQNEDIGQWRFGSCQHERLA